MTIICLVRHGETDWNVIGKLQGRTDIPLNEAGILQAEECSEFLKTSQWDVIITSPLKRAKQTAEIINKNVIVPVVEMEEFLERDYGDAEGMTYEERISKFPNKIYPNQEDRASFNKRVIDGIEKINQRYGDNKILLVAHGAVINTVLAILSNGEIGSGKTKLINACISNIYLHQDKWNIKDFNQISHLSKYN
ncbi:histidine phosphatase family protein [Psychrobacillus psychrodurans]|uniref:histidine phosphatase family protein n=1 Tax=Psychrobacillus TaxID=1221880 RepID=UPI001F4DBB88|nr:histidine phosphatase family protein [Psychrobacillus psychrodurans]